MKIAIVDDRPEEVMELHRLLKEYAAIHQIELEISVFTRASAMLAGYHPLLYAVIFLDIYMQDMTGLDAAQVIREQDPDTLLIFLTSSDEHRPEAFRLHAFDYIEKPADEAQIYRVMDDIFRRQTGLATRRFAFTCNREEYRLAYTDLICVQASGHYLEISDKDGNVYRTRMTFAAAEEELSTDSRFLLILRGILVNMDYITGFGPGVCCLKGGIRLPINVKNGKRIEQIWKNYVFKKIRQETQEREEPS